MTDLNAPDRFASIDPQGMLEHALALPQTCADAWALAQRTYPTLNLPSGFQHIVIVGMGGSAIGGDLLAALVADESPCPIMVQRGYQLPAFVQGPETLVIGVSYSGNTEETLSAFNQAHARGALLTALTTGGEMSRLADEWHIPVLRFDYPSQPRAALGYSFVPLLNLLCQLGLITGQAAALREAVDVMQAWQDAIGPQVPIADNPAKQLADALRDRCPVVYGAGLLQPVARRWKTQFNENSKVWAFFEALPELNHNAVVGFERSAIVREQVAVVSLHSRYDSARLQRRWQVTGELLSRESVEHHVVKARGVSRLAQMLSAIHFGDLVSVYLALANDIDPTPVAPINYLKAQLAATH